MTVSLRTLRRIEPFFGVRLPRSSRSGRTMSHLKLGVDLASLQLPLRKALQEAARMGAPGVQLPATGDLSPRRLSQTGRREFRHLLTTHNLDCAALVCPFRHGLDVAEGLMERIEILTQT